MDKVVSQFSEIFFFTEFKSKEPYRCNGLHAEGAGGEGGGVGGTGE